MFIVNNRKIFYVFSGAIFLTALTFFIIFGLNLSNDFTGGSLMELKFEKPIDEKFWAEHLKSFNLGKIETKKLSENSYVLRFKEIDEKTHQEIIKTLGAPLELRFDSIGPIMGKELKNRAVAALIVAFVLMFIYIYFAFRKSARLFSSWYYGGITILTLVFDIVIILGIFSFLGKYLGVEIGLSFIAAILAIVGYSINDRIIVFDRIRENLQKRRGEKFSEIVGFSLNQIFERSFNTTFTTMLVLLPLIFLIGENIRYFILALILGVGIGAYSSLFLASPLLTSFVNKKI